MFRVLVNDTQESPKAAVSFKAGAGPTRYLLYAAADLGELFLRIGSFPRPGSRRVGILLGGA